MRPAPSLTALAVVAALAAGPLAAAGPSHARSAPRTCARKDAKIRAYDKSGAVYTRPGFYPLYACAADGSRYRLSADDPENIQFRSLDIGGNFFAFAEVFCSMSDPCYTTIVTGALNGEDPHAFNVSPSMPEASAEGAEVTVLRISANRALAWIVCAGPTFAHDPPVASAGGKPCGVYARPSSQRMGGPTLLRTGVHLDLRFLHLSADGKTVTWRAEGRPRHRRIGP